MCWLRAVGRRRATTTLLSVPPGRWSGEADEGGGGSAGEFGFVGGGGVGFEDEAGEECDGGGEGLDGE